MEEGGGCSFPTVTQLLEEAKQQFLKILPGTVATLGKEFHLEPDARYDVEWSIGCFHTRHGSNASWKWRPCYCARLPDGRTEVRYRGRFFSLLHALLVSNGFLRGSRLLYSVALEGGQSVKARKGLSFS